MSPLDLGMQINQAMFMVNGRCGYILKPERLRKYESLTTNALATMTTWKLTIEVTSCKTCDYTALYVF